MSASLINPRLAEAPLADLFRRAYAERITAGVKGCPHCGESMAPVIGYGQRPHLAGFLVWLQCHACRHEGEAHRLHRREAILRGIGPSVWDAVAEAFNNWNDPDLRAEVFGANVFAEV